MPNRKILALALAALIGFYILPRVRDDMAARLTPAEPVPAGPVLEVPVPDFDRRTSLTLLAGARLVTYTLHDYLCGVLCAELPAEFPEECWKAQAVAARSYALYKMEHDPPAGHLGAQMCTDYTCCTGFRAPAEALAVWGSGAQTLIDRAEAAVSATDGIVAVYDGAVIGAVWHSASAPWTAAAAQVWGGEVPYLQETESPGGTDSASYYGETRIPVREFLETVTAAEPAAEFGSDPLTWFQNSVRSRGGYIVTVEVGGVPMRGSTVRSLLELPSAAFTYRSEGQELVFSTEGTGHGVGMSQYGAAAMARAGSSWDQILTHYYSGIKLLRKS